METYNNINDKLLHIQQKLSAPKTKSNEHGHYKYRSTEDILEAVKPLLKEIGCIILLTDEIQEAGGKLYIKASAKLTDGKEMVICTAYAREAERLAGMSEPQITGAASSYARKYALCGLLAIDDNKDIDSLVPSKVGEKTTAADKAADILGEALSTVTPQKKNYNYGKMLKQVQNDPTGHTRLTVTSPDSLGGEVTAQVDELPF